MRLTRVFLWRGGLAGLLCAVTLLACNPDTRNLALVPLEADACGPCGGTSSGPVPIPNPAQSAGGPCVTSVDCAGGLVCGYDPAGGCDAQGECVVQVAGPAGVPACGCDGNPVQYVAPGFTGVPVATSDPCGADSGAADAGGSESHDAGASADAGASDADDGQANDGEANDGGPGDGDVTERG